MTTREYSDTIRPRIWESRGLGYAGGTSRRYGTHHLYGDRMRQTSLITLGTIPRRLVYPHLFSSSFDL